MRWENVIRDRLENYESQLPKKGFEDLFSETSSPRNPFVRRTGLNAWPLIPVALVSCLIIIFFNGPLTHEHRVVSVRDIEPVQLAEDRNEFENNPSADAEKPGQLVQICEKQKELSALAEIETTAAELQSEKTDDKSLHGATLPDSLSRIETDTVSLMKPLQSEAVSQPAGTRRLTEAKVMGIGASGLAALALVTNNVTIGGPSASSDPIIPTTSLHHYFPLKIGLSVAIPWNQRWRFVTGLSYSRYSSKLTTPTFSKMLRVHFLGIPVRLDGVIVSNRRYDLYAGGGIEPEVCFAANTTDPDRFLFSFEAVTGAQVFITDHVAAYIEPTLFWTPSADSFSPETYHTRSPFSFSLSVGLRFNVDRVMQNAK